MVHHQLLSSSPSSSPISFDNRRICYRFPRTKDIAIYVSGGLFAIGWWAFIDALVYTKLSQNSSFNVTLEAISGSVTTLGMLLVALIDKSIFSDEFYIYSRKTLWKARLLLFLGFTFMVTSLIGSVALFVIKYVPNEKSQQEFYFGIAVVVQNFCIMMSSLILLIGQNSNNDAKYDYLL